MHDVGQGKYALTEDLQHFRPRPLRIFGHFRLRVGVYKAVPGVNIAFIERQCHFIKCYGFFDTNACFGRISIGHGLSQLLVGDCRSLRLRVGGLVGFPCILAGIVQQARFLF